MLLFDLHQPASFYHCPASSISSVSKFFAVPLSDASLSAISQNFCDFDPLVVVFLHSIILKGHKLGLRVQKELDNAARRYVSFLLHRERILNFDFSQLSSSSFQ